MSFENIFKYQKDVVKLIDNSYKLNRLSQVYMFSGPRGVGKMEAALYFACKVLCKDGGCLMCRDCESILNNTNSHVHIVTTDSDLIKKDQIIDLMNEFSLTSDTNEIFIIDGFDKVSERNANTLLKFLEGLHEGCFGILLVNDSARILPTIKSRCQVVHFNPLNKDIVKDALIDAGFDLEKANIISLLTYNVDEAKELAEDENITNLIALSKSINKDIEENGYPFVRLISDGGFLLSSQTKELHHFFCEMLIAIQRDKITMLSNAKASSLTFTSIEDPLKVIEAEIDILEIILKAKERLGYFVNIELLYSSMFIDIMRC